MVKMARDALADGRKVRCLLKMLISCVTETVVFVPLSSSIPSPMSAAACCCYENTNSTEMDFY